MFINFGSAFWVGFLLSVLFVLLLRMISIKKNLLVTQGVPSSGGIGMAAAFFCSLLIYSFQCSAPCFSSELWSVLAASLLLLIAGVIDDVRESSVFQKFLVQFIAAAILVFSGVRTHIVYIGDTLNILVSFLWIIGITNAVNLLDVMDGLAAGTSLIISFCFAMIAFFSDDMTTGVLSLALAGSISGFLLYNLPPAKVYMGNSGSHFLGLLLAAIALTARYATLGKGAALLTPVLILGFPIFDTAFLVLMRLKKGRSAFNKSNDHLALRYLRQGHSKGKTLVLMLGLVLLFVLCGFSLILLPDAMAGGIFGGAFLLGVIFTKKMAREDIGK